MDITTPSNFKFVAATQLYSYKLFIESRMDIDYIGRSFECDPVTLYYTIIIAINILVKEGRLDIDEATPLKELFTKVINRLITSHDINTSLYLESSKLEYLIYDKLKIKILHSAIFKIPTESSSGIPWTPDTPSSSAKPSGFQTENELDKIICIVRPDKVIEVLAVVELKLNPNDIDIGLSRKQPLFKLVTSKKLFEEHPLISITAGNTSSSNNSTNATNATNTYFIDKNSFKRFKQDTVLIGPHSTREITLFIRNIYFITKCRKMANIEMKSYSKYIGDPINCKFTMISTPIHRHIMPELFKQWRKDRSIPEYITSNDLLQYVYGHAHSEWLYMIPIRSSHSNSWLLPY
jgi:hypothetical protein